MSRDITKRVNDALGVIAACLDGITDPFDNYQRDALREAQDALNKAMDAFLDGALNKAVANFCAGCLEPSDDAAEKSLDAVIQQHVAEAVQTLGDAVDHAHRDGWTETRKEVAVCVEAFRILTTKEQAA